MKNFRIIFMMTIVGLFTACSHKNMDCETHSYCNSQPIVVQEYVPVSRYYYPCSKSCNKPCR